MGKKLVTIGQIALAFSVAIPALYVAGPVRVAHAAVVSSIIIEGNRRVENDTIFSYMQVQRGENATADNIDASIKALFQTGLFADVRIFRRGNSLVVQVEENPLINRVKFEGNDELDDKKLAQETELRERVIYTRSRVQSDVQRIAALYRRSGFYGVTVEPKIIRLSQNRVNLVFEITEGKETKVKSITFSGNEAFSDSRLRSVINTAESAWWKFFSSNDKYDPDRLNFDKELLRRHYLQNGYADFQVLSATAELAPDGENFFINFTVSEGPQYTVGSVAVNTGQTTLKPDQLTDAFKIRAGEEYDAGKVEKTVENITVEAGKAGFAFARVQPNIVRDEANRTLNITYDIQEGPRVYVERIDIVGNTRTLDKVIRRELRLVEGDAYNRIMIDKARRRLTALDFFEKIDFRERPGSSPDKVILEIVVAEKSTGTLNFSAGYSTDEALIGSVSVSERNLLGRGQFVRLNTSMSFKRQSVDFSFTEPYFLDRRLSVGVDAYATRTDNTEASAFTTQQYGGAVRLGLTLSEYSSLNFKYGFTLRDTTANSQGTTAPAIFAAAKKDYISLLGLSFIYDDLDNPLIPTKGFRAELDTELAGLGGDQFYGKLEARGFYFHPVFRDDVVVRFKATAGHIQGWNGKSPSVLDMFQKGGDSLRGFAQAGIGPRQRTPSGQLDAIGARSYLIGSVEMTFPLGLPESFGIQGAVFSDFGTAFGTTATSVAANTGNCKGGTGAACTVFNSTKIRASVGGGLLWQSPFGPLRIDVAYPLSKASFDKTELVRFGIGTRF
jgi:outer membrane protein insertion porin family